LYERFTERARSAVVVADLACREFGHEEVGTEHLLLGVMQEGGTAQAVLRAMGASPDAARATTLDLWGKGEHFSEAQLTFSADALTALEVAYKESLGFHHERVGTEHLLLGLLRQSSSRAVTVLSYLRVDPDSVRERVLDLIGTPGFVSPELALHTAPTPIVTDLSDPRALAEEVARLRTELARLRAAVERLERRG
jgi:ATP-dependent Clp protease ATP-binding subunit ClpC